MISDSIALFNLKAVYSPDAEQFFFVWSHEFTLGSKNYAKVRGRFLDLNGKLSEVKTYSFPQFKLGDELFPALGYNSRDRKYVLWWNEYGSPDRTIAKGVYNEGIDLNGRIKNVSRTTRCCLPINSPVAYHPGANRFLMAGSMNLYLFDGSGALITSPGFIPEIFGPFLFSDPEAFYFYLFSRSSGYHGSVFYQRLSADAERRSATLFLKGRDFLPVVNAVYNQQTNEILFLYQDVSSPNPYSELYTSRVDPTGRQLSEPRPVASNYALGNGFGLAAVDESYLLVYRRKEEIHARLLGRFGGPIGEDVKISSNSEFFLFNLTAIGSEQEHRFLIYWTDNISLQNGHSDLYAQLVQIE